MLLVEPNFFGDFKMSMNVIDQIQQHAQRISDGLERVSPGMPLAFTTASTPGDCIWQGDLGLIISDSPNPPAGYKKSKNPSTQLVPGNTVGARHCLDSLEGVEMHIPETWNEESLQGPFLKFTQDRQVLHPTHGCVTIPAGFNVECVYQREWDKIQAAERRARD